MRIVKKQRLHYWNRCQDQTDLQEQKNSMIYVWNFIVNQTFSIINKSFFKVKKKHVVRVVALVGSQELDRVWSFNSNWRCSPFFIRFDILTNFFEKYKEPFFTKDLAYKAKFFFQIWPIDLMSLYNVVVTHVCCRDVHLALFALRSL